MGMRTIEQRTDHRVYEQVALCIHTAVVRRGTPMHLLHSRRNGRMLVFQNNHVCLVIYRNRFEEIATSIQATSPVSDSSFSSSAAAVLVPVRDDNHAYLPTDNATNKAAAVDPHDVHQNPSSC